MFVRSDPPNGVHELIDLNRVLTDAVDHHRARLAAESWCISGGFGREDIQASAVLLLSRKRSLNIQVIPALMGELPPAYNQRLYR